MDKDRQALIKDKLAKAIGVKPEELGEVLSDLTETVPTVSGSSGMVHDFSGLLFFRCTNTHHGPVRDRNGKRQFVRLRANELPSELMRVWVEGRIYPFQSLKQLPKRIEAVYERDEKGNVVFIDDPLNRNPYANQVPQFKTVVDPKTGRRSKATQVSRENEGVQFFERVKLPPNEVQEFLSGKRSVGIENPVSAAKVDGNYVRNFSPVDAVPLTTAEKVALFEREERERAARYPVKAQEPVGV